MSNLVIRVENLSKKYIIRHANGRAGGEGLRHALQRAATAPFRALRNNFRSPLPATSLSEEFWALKDVSFDVRRGEVLGIIGRNGAGKSTLLKILSRITEPTTGRIGINGRVASLLEVGTGFHPELTGRENIYLNGAILGMSRAEVKRKFDEIVDFSGVEKFINTPVKHYSSGMYVRLAFAVAAHMEPEILIVDEVLAVGDIEFQKKSLIKMQDVAGGGRTVLFVSHNIGTISMLCSTAILLIDGQIRSHENAAAVTEEYLRTVNSANDGGIREWQESKEKKAQFTKIEVTDEDGNQIKSLPHNKNWKINLLLSRREIIADLYVSVHVDDANGTRIFTTQKRVDQSQPSGMFSWTIPIPGHFIRPRVLSIIAALHVPNVMMVDFVEAFAIIELIDAGSQYSIYGDTNQGCVFYPGENLLPKSEV